MQAADTTPDAVRPSPAPADRAPAFRLSSAGPLAFTATAATLALNLVTGIVVARALGPDGRGALAAITASVPIIGLAFQLGAPQAAAFYQARRPTDGPRLLACWLAVLLPLGGLAVLVGELVLPYLLAAQSESTLDLARLYMLAVFSMFVGELFYAVALGDHDFRFYYGMHVAQPLAIAVGFVVLWALDRFSLGAALVVMLSAFAIDNVISGTRALRRHGLGRPSRELVRTTLWYGLRAQGTTFGGALNTRLDVMIVPAFLAASSVGLYSVATNVSWLIVSLSSALAVIVLPAAARAGERGVATVLRSLQVTLLVALALAATVALLAEVAVRAVYGADFGDSVTAIRLLLPGCVLYAGATVLAAGLYALDRPLQAGIAQAAGIVVTVAGLVLFLERGGIEAAALVSTVAYTIVFAGSLLLYRRAAGLSWRRFLPPSVELRGLAQ